MARPLTKRDQNGKLYTRPPDIEAKIDVALLQDLHTLGPRVVITDRDSPNHLPSECLVHLIRDARRRDDHVIMNALLPLLLSRCEARLLHKIPDGKIANAAYFREEVLWQFAELFAAHPSSEEHHELDYYECKFNSAFRSFRLDLVRREINRTKKTVQLPAVSDEDQPTPDDARFAGLSKALSSPATQETSASLAELNAAIDALPPDERKAVVLCHRLGYDVESEDPNKTTAATLCGVTGRTIRNRLNRAAEMLVRFKEEE